MWCPIIQQQYRGNKRSKCLHVQVRRVIKVLLSEIGQRNEIYNAGGQDNMVKQTSMRLGDLGEKFNDVLLDADLAQVRSKPRDLGIWDRRQDPLDGIFDTTLVGRGDGHLYTFEGGKFGGGKTNTGGATDDENGLALDWRHGV